MKTDRIFKTALLSLSINLVYGIYHGIIGLTSHSWWFITLCAYYTILSVMRFTVLLAGKKSHGNFIKKLAGFMLIILSVVLSGSVLLSAIKDRGIVYHEITMIAIATYTFTKMTLGIVNLVKSKKNSSPTVKTLRNISFADAFVSIFALQRSMLVSFPGMEINEIRLFNILTGTAVCIIVFILGLNLIEGRIFIMAKSKIIKANEKIAETVVGGYKKIEDTVVGTYKKIENAAVKSYTKIEDKFVDNYLTHDGETVEEAKERLKKEQNS